MSTIVESYADCSDSSILYEEDDLSTDLMRALLDEFKYRHALFWKLVFRLSSAIVVLYTIPLLKPSETQSIVHLLPGFPMVGLTLSLGGIVLLSLEYRLLAFVESNYNSCKEKLNKGCSNLNAIQHHYIGYLVIIVWGSFFSLLGVSEILYLLLRGSSILHHFKTATQL